MNVLVVSTFNVALVNSSPIPIITPSLMLLAIDHHSPQFFQKFLSQSLIYRLYLHTIKPSHWPTPCYTTISCFGRCYSFRIKRAILNVNDVFDFADVWKSNHTIDTDVCFLSTLSQRFHQKHDLRCIASRCCIINGCIQQRWFRDPHRQR
eukprot:87713_1